jgi:hypothetical protein
MMAWRGKLERTTTSGMKLKMKSSFSSSLVAKTLESYEPATVALG